MNAGDELPPLEIPITRTLIVAGAMASRDYQDVHHDAELARQKGSPDIFMNILTTNGLVGRYITDHFGPTAVLRRVAVRLGAPNYPGDTMVLTGRVEKVDGDTATVRVVGANSIGRHVTGTVTVTVPPGVTVTVPPGVAATEPKAGAKAAVPGGGTATEPARASAAEPARASAMEPARASAKEPAGATAAEPCGTTVPPLPGTSARVPMSCSPARVPGSASPARVPTSRPPAHVPPGTPAPVPSPSPSPSPATATVPSAGPV